MTPESAAVWGWQHGSKPSPGPGSPLVTGTSHTRSPQRAAGAVHQLRCSPAQPGPNPSDAMVSFPGLWHGRCSQPVAPAGGGITEPPDPCSGMG